MEINFVSRKLQKACNSEKEMRAKFGKPLAERLQQRLTELKAALERAKAHTVAA